MINQLTVLGLFLSQIIRGYFELSGFGALRINCTYNRCNVPGKPRKIFACLVDLLNVLPSRSSVSFSLFLKK